MNNIQYYIVTYFRNLGYALTGRVQSRLEYLLDELDSQLAYRAALEEYIDELHGKSVKKAAKKATKTKSAKYKDNK